jgi:hypothetical protein
MGATRKIGRMVAGPVLEAHVSIRVALQKLEGIPTDVR